MEKKTFDDIMMEIPEDVRGYASMSLGDSVNLMFYSVRDKHLLYCKLVYHVRKHPATRERRFSTKRLIGKEIMFELKRYQ